MVMVLLGGMTRIAERIAVSSALVEEGVWFVSALYCAIVSLFLS